VPDDLGRSRFTAELQDPRVRDKLLAYTKAEVGGQGPAAWQAFIETTLNRAVARGKTLADTLSGAYFPRETHQNAARGVNDKIRASYDPVVQSVLAGSNVTNYATGNASGTVGFAGGPQTYAAGGERFGVEGPDRGWWTRIGAPGPGNIGSVPYTAQQPQTLAGLQSQMGPMQSPARPSLDFKGILGGGPLTDAVGAAILKKYQQGL
jgi:hypothetical protein